MNTTEFVYWLQGFFELSDAKDLTPTQVQVIKDHLALVFDKKTPDRQKQYLGDSLYVQPTGHGILSC